MTADYPGGGGRRRRRLEILHESIEKGGAAGAVRALHVVASRLFGDRGPGGAPYEVIVDPKRPHSDMGWEIYPEGLYRALVRFKDYPWPLIVTENGVADRAGTIRPGFIRAHAYAVDRARADGVNVKGYVYWSLIDNFEWSHGSRGASACTP